MEGPEGSGKSTQARRLARYFRAQGRRVTLLRDPGSTALGRALRRVLLHSDADLSPMAEALLFIGGRVRLVDEKIAPALRSGRVVVCDRFHDSTVVYQGHAGGVDPGWLDRAGKRAIRGLMPRLTLLLDLPAEQGFARRGSRRDRMERKALEFHRRVRRGFLRVASGEPRRVAVIDASRPRVEVWRQIESAVRARAKG